MITDAQELGYLIDEENNLIASLKEKAAKIGMQLSEESEKHLRLGFRTEALIRLAIKRHEADAIKAGRMP